MCKLLLWLLCCWRKNIFKTKKCPRSSPTRNSNTSWRMYKDAWSQKGQLVSSRDVAISWLKSTTKLSKKDNWSIWFRLCHPLILTAWRWLFTTWLRSFASAHLMTSSSWKTQAHWKLFSKRVLLMRTTRLELLPSRLWLFSFPQSKTRN